MTKEYLVLKEKVRGIFWKKYRKSLTKQAICAASLLTAVSKEALVVKNVNPIRNTTRRTDNEIPESKRAPSRNDTRPHKFQMVFLAQPRSRFFTKMKTVFWTDRASNPVYGRRLFSKWDDGSFRNTRRHPDYIRIHPASVDNSSGCFWKLVWSLRTKSQWRQKDTRECSFVAVKKSRHKNNYFVFVKNRTSLVNTSK